ncbi:hypothetical protein ACS2QU_26525 [Bacillus cereus group sp. Bce005]|uniref:hypothetical protein n=1 Tax=Bacillus cereus group sp. Bce005 TaxID=3445256 RepID=UPI003F2372E5
MLESKGAEGAIGENGYLQLWSFDILIQHNEVYEVKEFAPGVTLFVTDGGNVAYGFFEKSGETQIIEIPLIGMDLNEMEVIGVTFNDFIDYLYNKEY